MARENFSIGAFYNITKNQDNPIKTVGRDSFLSPKTPKNTSFLGVTQPQGSHSPYFLGDTTRPRLITYVQVWSKSDQRRLRKTAQTNRHTDRHYENNGHLAVNQKWCKLLGHSDFWHLLVLLTATLLIGGSIVPAIPVVVWKTMVSKILQRLRSKCKWRHDNDVVFAPKLNSYMFGIFRMTQWCRFVT